MASTDPLPDRLHALAVALSDLGWDPFTIYLDLGRSNARQPAPLPEVVGVVRRLHGLGLYDPLADWAGRAPVPPGDWAPIDAGLDDDKDH